MTGFDLICQIISGQLPATLENWHSGLKSSAIKDFSPHYKPFLWWLYDRIRFNLSDRFRLYWNYIVRAGTLATWIASGDARTDIIHIFRSLVAGVGTGHYPYKTLFLVRMKQPWAQPELISDYIRSITRDA